MNDCTGLDKYCRIVVAEKTVFLVACEIGVLFVHLRRLCYLLPPAFHLFGSWILEEVTNLSQRHTQ